MLRVFPDPCCRSAFNSARGIFLECRIIKKVFGPLLKIGKIYNSMVQFSRLVEPT